MFIYLLQPFFRPWRVDDASASNSSAHAMLNNKKIIRLYVLLKIFVQEIIFS